jgi:hypothetical protein
MTTFLSSFLWLNFFSFTFQIHFQNKKQNFQTLPKSPTKKKTSKNSLSEIIREIFKFFLWLRKKNLNIFELLIRNKKQIGVAGSWRDVKKHFELIFVRISGTQSTPTSQWFLPPFLS